jgi:hypothetical protein
MNSNAQETHYINMRQILKKQKVKERITWDVTKEKAKISVDRYDSYGNKIEAIEIYEGNRKLNRFIDAKWTNINTTTRFTFQYDWFHNQTDQINHDYFYNKEHHQNLMYRYDGFGNIERWETGASYATVYRRSYLLDEKGNITKSVHCFDSTCVPQKEFDAKWSPLSAVTNYFLKYDEKGMLIEKLANYIDAMAGYVWEYDYRQNGQLKEKRKYYVRSHFGVDKDTVTIADADGKNIEYIWKYTNQKDQLVKEVKLEYERRLTEKKYTYEYNQQELLSKEITEYETSEYIYNEKGMLTEKKIWYTLGEKKLKQHLKYEYMFLSN